MGYEEKLKALNEAIKINSDIMIESQAQIRQAHKAIEIYQNEYKRAMEKQIDLQAKLIEVHEEIKTKNRLEYLGEIPTAKNLPPIEEAKEN